MFSNFIHTLIMLGKSNIQYGIKTYTNFTRCISASNLLIHKRFYVTFQIINKRSFYHTTLVPCISKSSQHRYYSYQKFPFKWFLMRDTTRKWYIDDKLALASWSILATSILFILCTTACASILLYAISLIDPEHDYIRSKLEKYLSYQTGLLVQIQSLNPIWKDGCIAINKLTFQGQQGETIYDISIDQAQIKLGLLHFLEGKSIIKVCHLKGTRGSIDRLLTKYLNAQQSGIVYEKTIIPYISGEFDLDRFIVEDLVIFVKYPFPFKSYEFVITEAQIPRLRRHWLLYDILSAERMTGSFDNCLFQLKIPSSFSNPRLRHFRVDGVDIHHVNGMDSNESIGPLSWITRGVMDINALIQLPSLKSYGPHDILLENIIELLDELRESIQLKQQMITNDSFTDDLGIEFGDKVANKILNISKNIISPLAEAVNRLKTKISDDTDSNRAIAEQFINAPSDAVLVHMDIKLRNIRATLPFYTNQLSLVSNTLAKPIISYINEHRPLIPLSCSIQMNTLDWAGAWTFYDSGFSDSLYSSVYDGFIQLINIERSKRENYKRMGLWSLNVLVRMMHQLYDSIVHYAT